MPHRAVAEDQLPFLWAGSETVWQLVRGGYKRPGYTFTHEIGAENLSCVQANPSTNVPTRYGATFDLASSELAEKKEVTAEDESLCVFFTCTTAVKQRAPGKTSRRGGLGRVWVRRWNLGSSVPNLESPPSISSGGRKTAERAERRLLAGCRDSPWSEDTSPMRRRGNTWITAHYSSLVKEWIYAHISYFKAVKEGRWRIRFHMCLDEGAQKGAAGWRRVRNSFGFGWQATPSAFQTGGPHHCRARGEIGWTGINVTLSVVFKSLRCLLVYLLWPFPPQGTSGSDSTDIGSSCVCPQGSFWQPNTHIWHFFVQCAAGRRKDLDTSQNRV